MRRGESGILFLSEDDMIKAGVLDTKKCCGVIEEVFELLGKGDFRMSGIHHSSHGTMVTFPRNPEFSGMPVDGPDRRYGAMPAYLGGRFRLAGLKWYGSNAENRNLGLPRSVLMTCLANPDTAEPFALMSANLASSCRTGCVPGVAAKYLAHKDAKSLAIVGCGVINRSCASAILNNMPKAEEVYLYDISRAQAGRVCEALQQQFSLSYIICDSLQQCLQDADIVSVAASGAVPVTITEELLKPGVLLTITGAFSCKPSFFRHISIVFDYWMMHKVWDEEVMLDGGYDCCPDFVNSAAILRECHAGHLREEDFLSLGDVVSGRAAGRTSDSQKILFMAGGLPLEDLAWGYVCYEEAVRQGLGTKLKLWDKPFWT